MKKIYNTPIITVEKMDFSLLVQTSDIYVKEEEGEFDAREYFFDFYEESLPSKIL